ncbi:MAG TPA: phosphoribosyltransferase [Candidatus Bathyarchaeia archaeon]|nr:phosphoribosyltransferase [Candidatus Bathyarchaeia archaeon]
MSSRKYVAPGWDRIYEMLLELALAIRSSGFKTDIIVGVSRGGWAPARVLSDLLENTRTASMKVEFYVGLEKTSSRPVVTQPVGENAFGKNVLIVDDVSDTGESLKVAIDHVNEKGAKAIKTATLYYKPHSKFKPDFFAESTGDWIIFPWERLEATKLLMQEAKAQNRGMETVRQTLRECSMNDSIIDLLFKLANGS